MLKYLGLGVALFLVVGCSSDSGDSKPMAPNADLQAKCDKYCTQLVSELKGCDRSEGASQSACQDYCYGHVSFDVEGVVKCGALAATCDAFDNCGELTK